jgi:hypothetical protein
MCAAAREMHCPEMMLAISSTLATFNDWLMTRLIPSVL